jgi:hypothetical protein
VASENKYLFSIRLGRVERTTRRAEQQHRSCEELISMLITFKVIILYITQVIISMQTSVKMGRAWPSREWEGRAEEVGMVWPYHGLEGSSEHAKNKIEKFTTCRMAAREETMRNLRE